MNLIHITRLDHARITIRNSKHFDLFRRYFHGDLIIDFFHLIIIPRVVSAVLLRVMLIFLIDAAVDIILLLPLQLPLQQLLLLLLSLLIQQLNRFLHLINSPKHLRVTLRSSSLCPLEFSFLNLVLLPRPILIELLDEAQGIQIQLPRHLGVVA